MVGETEEWWEGGRGVVRGRQRSGGRDRGVVGGGKGSGERETEEWWEGGRGVVRGRQRSGGRWEGEW